MADGPPLWLQIIQAASYVFGAGAAVVAAAKYQLDRDAAQRTAADADLRKRAENAAREKANEIAERELNWKRMEAAQRFLEDMEDDNLAAFAMTMLDWRARTYIHNDREHNVTEDVLLQALRTEGEKFNPTEVFVRDAFDHLFWYFERIQNQIDIDMLDIRHVEFPLSYLSTLIMPNILTFELYFDAYGYPRSKRLVHAMLSRVGETERSRPPVQDAH